MTKLRFTDKLAFNKASKPNFSQAPTDWTLSTSWGISTKPSTQISDFVSSNLSISEGKFVTSYPTIFVLVDNSHPIRY